MLSKGHKINHKFLISFLFMKLSIFSFKRVVCNRGQVIAMGVGKLIKKVIMWIQAALPLRLDTSVPDWQRAQWVRSLRFPSAESAASLSDGEMQSTQSFIMFEYVQVFQAWFLFICLFEWLSVSFSLFF